MYFHDDFVDVDVGVIYCCVYLLLVYLCIWDVVIGIPKIKHVLLSM
jgi:hypothetical protein